MHTKRITICVITIRNTYNPHLMSCVRWESAEISLQMRLDLQAFTCRLVGWVHGWGGEYVFGIARNLAAPMETCVLIFANNRVNGEMNASNWIGAHNNAATAAAAAASIPLRIPTCIVKNPGWDSHYKCTVFSGKREGRPCKLIVVYFESGCRPIQHKQPLISNSNWKVALHLQSTK